MSTPEITLAQFNEMAKGLPWKDAMYVFPVPKIVAVEPLEGRSTLSVKRRCILEDESGKRFRSWWD